MTSVKISASHIFSFESLTDYFLGNTDNLKSILDYRKSEDVKNPIKRATKHFDFLPEGLTTAKTVNRHNQILSGLISVISPTFNLMKPDVQRGFLSEFLKYLAVELSSLKAVHKKLMTKYQIRAKKLDELLLCGRNMDNEEFSKVFDYIAIRFGFNYALINNEQNYHRFVEFTNRPYFVLIQKGEKYYYVCEELNETQFKSILKGISPELKRIEKYKVAELKEIGKKYGISMNGKKEDLYNTLVKYFNG